MPVMGSMMAIQVVCLVAFIRYPKIAKVFFLLRAIFRVFRSVLPLEGVSPVTNLHYEATAILVEAVLFEVGFMNAAFIQFAIQVIVGAMVTPALYSNITMDSAYISYLFAYSLSNFAALLLYESIFDFCIQIMVENKQKSVEYS